MSNKSVPKLEHLAFMASYKDMFTNLGLIDDYETKHFDGDEDDSLENETSFASLYETISRVRDRLSQHLIGTMNDTTRYNPQSYSIFKLHAYYHIHCTSLYILQENVSAEVIRSSTRIPERSFIYPGLLQV